MSLSPAELARYSRHLALREFDVEGQEKLKAARVLIVGAGGLGSPAALYLAAAGVGTLGIVDCDRIDVSNLQRQVLYDAASVGRSKTDAARERLLSLNPDIDVIVHCSELRAANVREILADYDVILDGTDRFATRFLVNDACVLLRRSLVSAAIHRFEGQVMSYVPDRGPCYRCLFAQPPDDGSVPNCAEAGVLGVLPGVMGTIQATEAIKLIVGLGSPLVGRLLTYDALEMRFNEFRFERRTDCAVCGDRPTIREPQDIPAACNAELPSSVERLSPRSLRDRLATQSDKYALIDVREAREYEAGHFSDALHIPITELARRLDEVPAERVPVFLCRSGARSLTACRIALAANRSPVAHLEGGLTAWRTEVDPHFVVA